MIPDAASSCCPLGASWADTGRCTTSPVLVRPTGTVSHVTDNGHEEVENNGRMRPILDCRLFPCIGIFFDGRVETYLVDSRT